MVKKEEVRESEQKEREKREKEKVRKERRKIRTFQKSVWHTIGASEIFVK